MSSNFTYRFDNSFSNLRCYRANHGKCRIHRHATNLIEFAYVTDGRAKHVLNGDVQTVSKGDYFAVDVLSNHEFPEVYTDNIGMIICAINIDYFKSSFGRAQNLSEVFINKFPSVNLPVNVNKIYHDDDGTVLALFEEIMSESTSHHTAYTEKINCLLTEVLITMLRSYDYAPDSSISDAVQYVIDYVNQNYASDVSLLDISKKLYVSHSSLSQNFKKEVGISFNTFLQQRRVFQSCNMLAGTDSSVEHISDKVGYSDTKYFRETFKKIIGCTPREFRSNVKKSRVCPDRHTCLETNKYNYCELRRFCVHYS